MFKKVIPIVVALSVMFGISVMAQNDNIVVEEPAPEISEQIPQNSEKIPKNSAGIGDFPSGDMQGKIPPNMPGGEMPREGMSRGQRPSGNFTPPQDFGEFTPPHSAFDAPENNSVNNTTQESVPQTENNASEQNPQMQSGNQQFGGQMPGGMGGFPGNMQNFNGQTQEEVQTGILGFLQKYSTPVISVILLALAFIFVIFYRRKNY